MKLASLILAVALGGTIICVFGHARAGTTNSPPQSVAIPARVLFQTNGLIFVPKRIPAQIPFSLLHNPQPKLKGPMIHTLKTNGLPWFGLMSKAEQRPKPGVYETAPYTSIVIVPGSHADDCAIVWEGTGDRLRMPTLEPPLRFIPRTPLLK